MADVFFSLSNDSADAKAKFMRPHRWSIELSYS